MHVWYQLRLNIVGHATLRVYLLLKLLERQLIALLKFAIVLKLTLDCLIGQMHLRPQYEVRVKSEFLG